MTKNRLAGPRRPIPDEGAPTDPPTELDRETLVVAGVVLLGAIMSILDTTVVNVAIDRLAVDFGSALTTIQWVVTGYTLALAAVIPISGWASDRFGTKRLYLTSLVLFTIGSGLSGLAWSAGSLIGFRVLQGIGGGLILPVIITIITKKAGPARLGRVMAIIGVPMLVAPILGPILGGWLVEDVSWRWMFFIKLPIGIVATALAQVALEPDQPAPTDRLDVVGLLLLSPGLTLLIYGLAESSPSGFGDPRALAPTVIGGVLIAAFFVRSWRTEAPLVDVRTFARTRAGAAAIVFLLFAISFFGALLLIPLYYQSVRHLSALDTGLLLAPLGLGAMLTMPLAGRLSDRYGPSKLPAAGIPLLVIGLLPFAFVTDHTSYVVLAGSSFVLGLGNGLSMMPAMTAAMQAVPQTAIAETSTAMSVIRQVGASIGTALLIVILSAEINHRLAPLPGVPGGGFASLHSLPPDLAARVSAPLAEAFAHSFVWAIGMLVIAFVPALLTAVHQPIGARSDAPPIGRSETGPTDSASSDRVEELTHD
jgi:EmrB/QacA subfamily drug resistance transporter